MTELEQARLLAERYIDYQPRTSAEVRRRLAKGGFTEEVMEQVVADLERAGLLDDSRFSADWVESRNRRKGLGRVRLAAELRQKGVSREQAEEALQDLDPETELEGALELARKRVSSYPPEDPSSKRRLAAFLQRRGYGWDTIEQVFVRLYANTE